RRSGRRHPAAAARVSAAAGRRNAMPHARPLALVSVLALAAAAAAGAVGAATLSDNLSEPSAGTETAAGSKWLTASFGTGTDADTRAAVTLLLPNPTAGEARLDLYSDGGLEPGTLIATLTPPPAYSSTLAPATFTTSGVALAAATTYWV